ncbi:MAG TPA: tRNA 2-thiouridine(34) synthase MnmA [Gaiellaceae bacterium]|jgi:tRNA-specific 2-thiouridylase|nr:tRNA 2-thiouridine(34) synthase MnmA [Gaiellaceae bacterium]
MVELYGDSARGPDWAAVRLRVNGTRIVDADAPGIAQDLRGLSLLEAAAVGGELLPVDALANALAPAVSAPRDTRRVAVAMSGGVDSAVALLRAGPEAVGVTLRLWLDPKGPDSERACCSPSAVIAAREACHARGLPHVTLDLREAFRRAVVTPFVRGYARGETPNPCIACNGGFRFAELLAFAKRIGAAKLATGHYARIVEHEGRLLLARGADPGKDQSYMLGRVDPRFLDRIWFPLGEQLKTDTRAEAAAAGLAAAGRAESQEACFLAGDDYRAFLGRQGLASKPGAIVDENGTKIGTHDGFWRFTPGQRRGLGVAASAPLYALRTDARTNTVVAGDREALARRRVAARGRLHVPVRHVDAKLRYRSPAVGASAEATARGFRLDLDEPAYGVAVGQAAVLYDGDVVVGSGLITSAGVT